VVLADSHGISRAPCYSGYNLGSISISNIFTPYLLQIAESGGLEQAIRFDRGLKNGIYFYRGILTSKAVSNWFDIPHSDLNLLMF